MCDTAVTMRVEFKGGNFDEIREMVADDRVLLSDRRAR